MENMQRKRNIQYNRIWMAAMAFLAFLGTMFLPKMLNLKGESLVISNSWAGVFIWAVCFFLLNRGIQEWMKDKTDGNTRGTAAAGILAFFFALSLAFGAELDSKESVSFADAGLWLAVIVWGIIFCIWIKWAWKNLDGMSRNRRQKMFRVVDKGEKSVKKQESRLSSKVKALVRRWEGISGRKQFALLMLFLILCWLPVFLAVYPGFFVYDAQDELVQMQTRSFTTHHPLPHVLLLGGIILGVNKLTGSYNAGIAAYTIFQMLMMSGVFAYAICYMKKRGIRRSFRIMTALYFGFFPVVVMFTLCSAKDGIFSGALLLLLIAITDMAEKKEKFFHKLRNPIFVGISALIMMSFRHNGMYAFLVMAPVLILYMKDSRKKTTILLGAVFAAYFLLSAGLTGILGAEASENQEMLTVPIQQLSRTYNYDKESLTEEQTQALYEIIPREVLPYYTPKVSDGVKVWFNNEAFRRQPGRYIKLWLELGIRHPFTYLNAWFMTSYGFWYPDTIIDVYRGNSVFTYTYEDSSFFGYEVELPGVRESKLPWLNECYRRMSLEITQQKLPVIAMLFSPGFLFWLYAFTAGYAFYRKKHAILPPLLLIFLLWLTVILGPTYLPRYVLILWFALPEAISALIN